ncbi:MAG: hypothetical protein V2I38_15710 [Alcanivoracaceae bacterium]|jgi:hypothetical protein|nr:hypothetical protein [Alcanivoracaceae bacterium]
MKIRSSIIALVGVLVMAPALADVTAVYQLDRKNQMTVSVRDQNQIRMDVAKDMFMLLKGNKTYSVRKEGSGWVAMDMDEIAKMSGGFAGMPMGDDSYEDDGQAQGSFRDTGRSETVAGYQGKVYEVIDEEGERTEVVLSNHKDLTAITQGMARFGAQTASNMGFAGAGAVPDLSDIAGGYTGLLRQGKDMKLVSVDKSAKGSGYFDLPPGTLMEKMPDMGAAPGGMGLPPGMNMEDMKKQMEEAMKKMQQR